MTAIGPKECPNNMDIVTQQPVIGIDVSRDWLDIHCLPEGKRARLANKCEGHHKVAQLALEQGALVCFEGCED